MQLFFLLLLLLCNSCYLEADEGTPMRVQFRMEGGIAHFPGLSQPVMIDSDQLSQEEAAELRRLVDAAHFFTLPAKTTPPSGGAADYYRYTITVKEGGRQHTVELRDPVGDAELQKLLKFLRAKAKTMRTMGHSKPPAR